MLKNKKFSYKNLKLVTKTITIIGVFLFVSMALLILLSTMQAGRAVRTAINGEFSGIATQNGLKIESIINEATSTASNLQYYLNGFYNNQEAGSVQNQKRKSNIYNAELSETTYDAENYILNTSWSAINNNHDITNITVFFEPYAFDSNVKDYTVYVTSDNAKNRTAQTFGDYSKYASEDYYRIAKEKKEIYVTPPYEFNGVMIFTMSFPIMKDDEVKGVITVDMKVSNFSKIKTKDEKYPTMYVDIFTEDNTIVFDSESDDYITKKVEDLLPASDYAKITSKQQTKSEFHINTIKSDGSNVYSFYYPITCGNQTWWAASILKKSDLQKDEVRLAILMVTMAAIVLIFINIIIRLFLKKTLRPIDHVVKAATSIASGNLDIHIETKYNDEIGILSNTFMDMTKNLRNIIQDINYYLGQMSEGNFQIDSSHHNLYIGNYQNILLSMRNIRDTLSHTLSEINSASDQVSIGASQVSSSSQSLSQGATEQASSVEELAATINEISDKVKKNALNATEANDLSRQAGDGVRNCNEHMEAMNTAMNEITNTSNEVAKIIKAIDSIAFQTNILALNAAVEAARAGEAGKGFAVVADEVRNLAGKSAEAAKETAVLIESVQNAIKNGTEIAENTASSLQEVVEKTNITCSKIAEIAEVSTIQSNAIAQVTTGLDQISAVVQTTSASSEECAATSEELSSQAVYLKEMVDKFELMEMEGKTASVLTENTETFDKPVLEDNPEDSISENPSTKY